MYVAFYWTCPTNVETSITLFSVQTRLFRATVYYSGNVLKSTTTTNPTSVVAIKQVCRNLTITIIISPTNLRWGKRFYTSFLITSFNKAILYSWRLSKISVKLLSINHRVDWSPAMLQQTFSVHELSVKVREQNVTFDCNDESQTTDKIKLKIRRIYIYNQNWYQCCQLSKYIQRGNCCLYILNVS